MGQFFGARPSLLWGGGFPLFDSQRVQVTTVVDCHAKLFWKLTRINIGLLVHTNYDGSDIFAELVHSMTDLFRYSGGTHTRHDRILPKLRCFAIYIPGVLYILYSLTDDELDSRKRRVSML